MKTIEQLVKKLGEKCNEKHFSLVTAESCTGGGLAYAITLDPACSSILERGYIVYSIPAKQEVLDVSTFALQTFGAVSKEVAKEMAEKALEKSKCQISIAITGIDECATKVNNNKGIVWVGCAGIDKKTLVKCIEVKGNRKQFCHETILASLHILLDFIE